MDRDRGTQLVSAARSPRTAPEPDVLWQRGRRRRRRRRAAAVGALVSALLLGTVVVAQWAVRVPDGPIVSYAEGQLVMSGVDELVGTHGVVWALQDGRLVQLTPEGPRPWAGPDRICELRPGGEGWVVATSCGDAAISLVRPDLSTTRWVDEGLGVPLAAGPLPDGSTWAVTTDGIFLELSEGAESQRVDIRRAPTVATSAGGVVWVAVGSGDDSLVRIEDATVTYRVPLTIEPSGLTATANNLWVLGDGRVVQVDPRSNREVAGPTPQDAVDGLTGAGRAWTWSSARARQLDGTAEADIPSRATRVAATDDALFVLVDGDVVRVRLPAG